MKSPANKGYQVFLNGDPYSCIYGYRESAESFIESEFSVERRLHADIRVVDYPTFEPHAPVYFPVYPR